MMVILCSPGGVCLVRDEACGTLHFVACDPLLVRTWHGSSLMRTSASVSSVPESLGGGARYLWLADKDAAYRTTLHLEAQGPRT
jgi:hypothetical protein